MSENQGEPVEVRIFPKRMQTSAGFKDFTPKYDGHVGDPESTRIARELRADRDAQELVGQGDGPSPDPKADAPESVNSEGNSSDEISNPKDTGAQPQVTKPSDGSPTPPPAVPAPAAPAPLPNANSKQTS